MRRITPQMSSVQRRVNMGSVLKKAITTPTLASSTNQSAPAMNPMHGPVQLKSMEHLKWAQQLHYDSNWLNNQRVPQWDPLPDDYFDANGPTAGQQKDDLRREAGE